MIKYLITFSFLVISSFLVAGNEFDWGWATNTTNVNGDIQYGETVIDSAGNSYLVGSYGSKEFTFLDSTVTNRLYSKTGGFCIGACPPVYNYDAFVTKLSPNGKLVWMKTFGGIADDKGLSIDINDTGEVVVLFSSISEEIDFEGTVLNLTTNILSGYSNVVVKLNSDGSLNKMSEINMTRAYDPNAGKLRLDQSNIYIQKTFNSFNGSIQINNSAVSLDFNYRSEFIITLNANDLSINTFKQLGKPYTSGTFTNTFSKTQEIDDKWVIQGFCSGDGISFDDVDLVFQGSAKKYILTLNLDGSVSDLFELDESSYVNFTANENDVIVVSDQSPNAINDDLFHIGIYNYDGTLIKTHSFVNSVDYTPTYSINNMILDKNGNLTIALSFFNTFGIDGVEYDVEDYSDTVSSGLFQGKIISGNRSDVLLLTIDTTIFDYSSYYIDGNYFGEVCLDFVQKKDQLLMIGKHGSDITFGENTLYNEGDSEILTDHGLPTEIHKVSSLFIAEFEISDGIVGLPTPETLTQSHIYPNPAVNSFSISEEIEGEIEIYNLQGIKILTLENSVSEINFELPKGSYIVKFWSKNSQVYSESLIIE